MEKTEELANVLQTVLGNKEFIRSLMQNMQTYNMDIIEEKLGTVISYYIATRDTNTSYTYEEIKNRYDEIKDNSLTPGTTYYKNVVERGFFTHSFNGYKKDRIMQYGLNYMENITDKQTLEGIKESRERLEMLECILGRSGFVKNIENGGYEHSSDEVFITTPGTKTINYACRYGPERLYLGPLKQEKGSEEPIVVGETKQEYMFRVLTKKIQAKYADRNSDEYRIAMKLAKDVTGIYCSKSSAFALMSIEEMKDIPTSVIVFKPDDVVTLENRVDNEIQTNTAIRGRGIAEFFSNQTNGATEYNNLGDVVTLAQYIPDSAISGIVDVMDEFEMKQILAKAKGMKEGDLIDYNTCEYKGKSAVEPIVIDEQEDISEEAYASLRQQVLDYKKKQLDARNHILKNEIKKLEDKRQGFLDILEGSSKDKSTKYTLKSVYADMRKKGKQKEFMKNLSIIDNDSIEIASDTIREANNKHLTRTYFLTSVIMDLEDIPQRDREIVFEIIRNHDIGKTGKLVDEVYDEMLNKLMAEGGMKAEIEAEVEEEANQLWEDYVDTKLVGWEDEADSDEKKQWIERKKEELRLRKISQKKKEMSSQKQGEREVERRARGTVCTKNRAKSR